MLVLVEGARETAGVIRGLLLDFYGTLVEEDDEVVLGICHDVQVSARDGVTAAEVATRWWREFTTMVDGAVGASFRTQRELGRASLAATITWCGSTADPVESCQRLIDFWRRPRICADALAFLAAVAVPVCVVSNIDRADLEAALVHHGLDLDAVVCSEDARAYKPQVAPFGLALARLGLEAHEVLHVGDSLTADVAGANAAGIGVALINRRRQPIPAGLRVLHDLGSLSELPPLLHTPPHPSSSMP